MTDLRPPTPDNPRSGAQPDVGLVTTISGITAVLIDGGWFSVSDSKLHIEHTNAGIFPHHFWFAVTDGSHIHGDVKNIQAIRSVT